MNNPSEAFDILEERLTQVIQKLKTIEKQNQELKQELKQKDDDGKFYKEEYNKLLKEVKSLRHIRDIVRERVINLISRLENDNYTEENNNNNNVDDISEDIYESGYLYKDYEEAEQEVEKNKNNEIDNSNDSNIEESIFFYNEQKNKNDTGDIEDNNVNDDEDSDINFFIEDDNDE